MKEAPSSHDQLSETIFAVVRCEMADFVRNAEFHLEITTPALKPIARHLRRGSNVEVEDLEELELALGTRYLQWCDEENPIHVITVWKTSIDIAKCRLMQHASKHSSSCVGWRPSERNDALSWALQILTYDTKIMTSPLTKGFRWFNHVYFPFFAYIHIIQDLKKRPASEQDVSWEAMAENFNAWAAALFAGGDSPVFKMFTNVILEGWQTCQANAEKTNEAAINTPRIVVSINEILETAKYRDATSTGSASHDFTMPVSTGDFEAHHPMLTPGLSDPNVVMTQQMFPGFNPTQATMDAYISNQMEWTALGGWPGWGGF